MAGVALPQNQGSAPPTMTPELAAKMAQYVPQFKQPTPSVPADQAKLPEADSSAPVAPPAPIQQPTTPATVPQVPDGLDPIAYTLTHAIALQEGNGQLLSYSQGGKSGEYGRYQFMPGTWQAYAGQVLGNPNAPMTPDNQNQVAYTKIKGWLDGGATPAQAASMWNAGEGAPNAYQGNAGTNAQGVSYDTSAYAAGVQKYAQQLWDGMNNPAVAPGTPLPTYGATFPSSPNDNGLVAGFKALGNIPSSIINMAGGLLNTVLHPIQTVTTLGQGVIGGVENLTGENQGAPDQNQQVANAIGKALMDRYGSLDALQNTATNDPFGFGADIATILAGGAGAADLASRGAAEAGLVTRGTDLTGALGRATETVGGAVTSPISGTLSKLGETIRPVQDAEVAAAAQRVGADLPAGALTKSPLVRIPEALGQKGFGYQMYVDRVNAATAKIGAFAEDLVTQTGGTDDLVTAGANIAKGVKAYEQAFKNAYKEAWSPIEETIGNNPATSINRSIQTLKTLVTDYASRGLTSEAKYFQGKLSALTDEGGQYGPVTVSRLKQILGDVDSDVNYGRIAKQGMNVDQFKMMQLRSALKADLNDSIGTLGGKDMLQAYTNVSKTYADGMNSIGSAFLQKIRQAVRTKNYSSIIKMVTKPTTSLEDIERLKQVVGPDAWKDVQSTVMRQILDGAKNGEGYFTAQGIFKETRKWIQGDADKLASVLSPEQRAGLTDVGKLNEALSEAMKIAQGSQTPFIERSLFELGAVGYGGLKLIQGDIVGAMQAFAIPLGYEGASYLVSSPLGQNLLKMWMRSGLPAQVTESSRLIPPGENGTIGVHATTPTGTPSGAADGTAGAPGGNGATSGGIAAESFPFKHYSPQANLKELSPEAAGTGPLPGTERAEAAYPELHTPGVYGYAPATSPESTLANGNVYSGIAKGNFLKLGTPEADALAAKAEEFVKSNAAKYGEANVDAMNAAFKKFSKEAGYDGIVSGDGKAMFGFEPQKVTSLNSIIADAVKGTKENGGVTVSIYGDKPTSGYSMAISKDTEHVIPAEQLNDQAVLDYATKMYDTLAQPGMHLGLWQDGDKIYMDVSKVVQDEAQAVKEALANKQLAIYDLGKGETKYLKDYPAPQAGAGVVGGENAGGVSASSAEGSTRGGILGKQESEDYQAIVAEARRSRSLSDFKNNYDGGLLLDRAAVNDWIAGGPDNSADLYSLLTPRGKELIKDMRLPNIPVRVQEAGEDTIGHHAQISWSDEKAGKDAFIQMEVSPDEEFGVEGLAEKESYLLHELTHARQIMKGKLTGDTAGSAASESSADKSASFRFNSMLNKVYEDAHPSALNPSMEGRALQEEHGNESLTPRLSGIERRAFNQIAADGLDKTVDTYLALNGKEVSTDKARELFPEYRVNRSQSVGVHEPASMVAKAAYQKLLDTRKGEGDNTVLFVGGGTGSGKTSALLNNPELSMSKDAASVVYDSNHHNFASLLPKVQAALDKGYNVNLTYIYREPIDALTNGALPRAEVSGRTVPINEHIATHLGVPKTVMQAFDKFKNDDRVAIHVVDNSLGSGKATNVENPLDFIKQKVYTKADEKALASRAEEALSNAYSSGSISKRTYIGSKAIQGKGA